MGASKMIKTLVNVLKLLWGAIIGTIMFTIAVTIFMKTYTKIFTPDEQLGIGAFVSILLVAFLIKLYWHKGEKKPRVKKVAVDSKVLNGEYLMARDVEVLIKAKNMDKGALSDMIADKRLSYSHEGQEIEILETHPYMNYVRVVVKDTDKRLWVETDAVRVEKGVCER
jgi:hypothetical protein